MKTLLLLIAAAALSGCHNSTAPSSCDWKYTKWAARTKLGDTTLVLVPAESSYVCRPLL
jgi:hypothetical protein